MNEITLCSMLDCTGCKSCANSCPTCCISFFENSEGFEFPRIDHEKCVKCNRCVRSCPVISKNNRKNNNNPRVYVAYSNQADIVKESSSGGIFSVLANSVLSQGGVVFAAEMDMKSKRVFHRSVLVREELYKLRGSKYIQSDTGKTYVEVKSYLQEGRLVLFVGTPCQIAGLYAFLQKSYEFLYTADLVCHGVPSYRLFINYYDKIAKIRSLDGDFYFRNYTIWDFDTYLKTNNKKIFLLGSNDFYMRAFLSGEIFRESCYRCPFATLPRQGDISLADFWGIGKISRFGKKNRCGNSMVLVNNDKGAFLFSQIWASCYYEERNLAEAERYNHNIYEPSNRPRARDTIYQDMHLPLRVLAAKYGHQYTLRNYMGFIKRRIKEIIIKCNNL